METETVPFQLQFDKPISSQIKIAEWNPEKDLLAMVTEDSKLVLHRFNWQRLWTVSPGKGIITLCWRPDGKALAVGLEDGVVSLYDVENGKLLRSIKLHTAAIACLSWEEDAQTIAGDRSNLSTYEDRTSRFFPPPPRSPRMPGLVPGDSGFLDDSEDSFQELSTSCQRFNILCSGDTDGNLCFSIFGIFPIGKINIHSIRLRSQIKPNHVSCQLLNASIHKVALSKDLCNLVVLCSGEVPEPSIDSSGLLGFHCLVLDTSMFWNRKSELYQVALQASSIDDMIEVIRASFSVMLKQWDDAMRAFHEKFNSLSVLIANYGLDSTPQEEFLSLLGGARISPALHQFLVQSIGEAALKRMEKLVSGAGKELQLILLDHVQPAAEIIGFRMGELRGFSRWLARYQSIGLDEKLIENATEKAGMFLVQVERFMKVLSSVVQQFSNFFSWLLKSTRTLMSEPSDQLLPFSSELVIVFLKFLYDQDPLKQLLDSSEIDSNIRVDYKTAQRVSELVHFGGFSDTDYLRRTLAEEFQQMVSSFKEAFDMPFVTMSKKILCKDLIPLFPLDPSQGHVPSNIAASLSIYKDTVNDDLDLEQSHERMTGYMLFKIPDESFSNMSNCIGIARGFVHGFGNSEKGEMSLEAALFSVPNGFNCVDLSLYKEGQIALLLNETATSSESSGGSRLMLVQACDLPFASLLNSSSLNSWKLNELVGSAVHLKSENERVREIPHPVVAPLSVSASRGVACVFAARKRALVYILEEDEDEDEMSDSE